MSALALSILLPADVADRPDGLDDLVPPLTAGRLRQVWVPRPAPPFTVGPVDEAADWFHVRGSGVERWAVVTATPLPPDPADRRGLLRSRVVVGRWSRPGGPVDDGDRPGFLAVAAASPAQIARLAGTVYGRRHRPAIVVVVDCILSRPDRRLDQLAIGAGSATGRLLSDDLADVRAHGEGHDLVASLIAAGVIAHGSTAAIVERFGHYVAAGADEILLDLTLATASFGAEEAIADVRAILDELRRLGYSA